MATPPPKAATDARGIGNLAEVLADRLLLEFEGAAAEMRGEGGASGHVKPRSR
ncbi:MAG: hypothetical protein ABSB01_14375 [Streptosporangiaceae bacterium]